LAGVTCTHSPSVHGWAYASRVPWASMMDAVVAHVNHLPRIGTRID
jgi:hypothetical protein